MLITLAGWMVCLAAGVALQRRLRDPRRASHILFMVTIWVVTPLVVIYAYTTVVVRVKSWRPSPWPSLLPGSPC